MSTEFINRVLNRVKINRQAKKTGLLRTSGEVMIGLLQCQIIKTKDPGVKEQLERRIQIEKNLDEAARKAGISFDSPHLQ